MDTNQDRLVTLEEFLASTQRKEFGDTGEGWEVRTRATLGPDYPSLTDLTLPSGSLATSLSLCPPTPLELLSPPTLAFIPFP